MASRRSPWHRPRAQICGRRLDLCRAGGRRAHAGARADRGRAHGRRLPPPRARRARRARRPARAARRPASPAAAARPIDLPSLLKPKPVPVVAPVAAPISADPPGAAPRGTMIMVHAGGWAGHDAHAQRLLMEPSRRPAARPRLARRLAGLRGGHRRPAGRAQRRGRRARPRHRRRSRLHLRRVGRRAPRARRRRAAARDRLRHRPRHADRPVALPGRGGRQPRRPAEDGRRPDDALLRRRAGRVRALEPRRRSPPRSTPTCCSCTRPPTRSSRPSTTPASRPRGPRRSSSTSRPATPADPAYFMHGTVSDAGRGKYMAAIGAFADRAVAARTAERSAARTGCSGVGRSLAEVGLSSAEERAALPRAQGRRRRRPRRRLAAHERHAARRGQRLADLVVAAGDEERAPRARRGRREARQGERAHRRSHAGRAARRALKLAIRTQGPGRRFGERVAIASIDLQFRRSCAFGFLGPGDGNTTLIPRLLGLAARERDHAPARPWPVARSRRGADHGPHAAGPSLHS